MELLLWCGVSIVIRAGYEGHSLSLIRLSWWAMATVNLLRRPVAKSKSF